MKRKILFVSALICMTLSFHACDELSNCKVCKQVTKYDSTGEVYFEGNESEYCDAALIGIQATQPVSAGGKTTRWECR
jgi:hypothetical protein